MHKQRNMETDKRNEAQTQKKKTQETENDT